MSQIIPVAKVYMGLALKRESSSQFANAVQARRPCKAEIDNTKSNTMVTGQGCSEEYSSGVFFIDIDQAKISIHIRKSFNAKPLRCQVFIRFSLRLCIFAFNLLIAVRSCAMEEDARVLCCHKLERPIFFLGGLPGLGGRACSRSGCNSCQKHTACPYFEGNRLLFPL